MRSLKFTSCCYCRIYGKEYNNSNLFACMHADVAEYVLNRCALAQTVLRSKDEIDSGYNLLFAFSVNV